MNQTAESVTCRVCTGSTVQEWLHPREMMFGLREEFNYFRCSECGCLQLAEIPNNMDTYYSQGYYSCRDLSDLSPSFGDRLKRRWLYPNMTKSKLGWPGIWGKFLCSVGSGPPLQHWLAYLEGPIPLDLAILDVGCGSGEDLLGLKNCGFSNLRGVDPYIKAPISYEGGLEIMKCGLEEVTGSFDLIMFHHVFEHLENPQEILLAAKNLLTKKGRIMIRIPLSDSAACETYKECWSQLDAPRHITLQTQASMDRLAKQTGLQILRVAHDSSAFQFWGSEQYRLDIPLSDPRSYSRDPESGVFSKAEIQSFNEESKRLNEQGRGDQAAFVLASMS